MKKIKSTRVIRLLLLMLAVALAQVLLLFLLELPSKQKTGPDPSDNEFQKTLPLCKRSRHRVDTFVIHYGQVTESTIIEIHKHQMVVLYPHFSITRDIVEKIQKGRNIDDPSDNVIALGYISIGEDVRTIGKSVEELLSDERFTGDGSGPRVDPRGPHGKGGSFSNLTLEHDSLIGLPTPSVNGTRFASFYLDDNSLVNNGNATDGIPDRNQNFGGAFTNIGDVAWYEVLQNMTLDGQDHTAGIREILTLSFGRGLGFDGLFLDTVDTTAPNHFTDEFDENQSEFEWTATGYLKMLQRLAVDYPDTILMQNRGVFFFDNRFPHFSLAIGKYIDFLLLESFRLDSNPHHLYHQASFDDNRFNYAPKIMAEASRVGFQVLSLGYAEGPADVMAEETLVGKSVVGYDELIKDIQVAHSFGFRHYLANANVSLVNAFVQSRTDYCYDEKAPTWASTQSSFTFPPKRPFPRVGVQKLVSLAFGKIGVSWDVALDMNQVYYDIYSQTSPFVWKFDGVDTSNSRKIRLKVEAMEKGYEIGEGDALPYTDVISGFYVNTTYWFLIRAKDEFGNQEKNNFALSIKYSG